MTRIDWSESPELGEGLDRGVLYLPQTYLAWSEEGGSTGGGDVEVVPGEDVTTENSNFYDVTVSDPIYDPPGQPHSTAVYTLDHIIGETAIRLTSKNISDSFVRWAGVSQHFYGNDFAEVTTWVKVKAAHRFWGRFYMGLAASGSESGSTTYASFIIEEASHYDPEIDDMVSVITIHTDVPPGVLWDDVVTIDLEVWYKLTISMQGDEAVFTVRDVEETVLGTVTKTIEPPVGALSFVADFQAITADPLTEMDVIIDGLESNLAVKSNDDPPDYGYAINYVDGVPWNGLVSVEEKDTAVLNTALYFDGRRQQAAQSIGNFEAALSAMTYPDQLEGRFGKLIGLSYRAHSGENTYLHLVYNGKLLPFTRRSTTRSSVYSVEPFSWNLVTKPFEAIAGGPPVAHMIVDVSHTPYPDAIVWLEEILYGSEGVAPRLPSPAEVVEIFEAFVVLLVTQNGDGTMTITGPDDWVTDSGDGLYEISSPSLLPLNDDLYQISSY